MDLRWIWGELEINFRCIEMNLTVKNLIESLSKKLHLRCIWWSHKLIRWLEIHLWWVWHDFDVNWRWIWDEFLLNLEFDFDDKHLVIGNIRETVIYAHLRAVELNRSWDEFGVKYGVQFGFLTNCNMKYSKLTSTSTIVSTSTSC